ncbi:hypothetical protein WA026_020121 [Henosepilachna vigintioctopunctata]|uniref:Palmitoyltransferase n=1 Tax=Henosepilachna vigintioctopunctata TaxID=420089 RepID=A0AAW1UCV5_9CUCU
MRIRSRILPKSFQDAIITSFLILIIPFIFNFEIFIVLPHFYELWSPAYIFHVCTGTFILWNLCSNLVAIILCDSSIKGVILPSNLKTNWKFCTACECITPPRSWHCEVCNVCILKRDHHCKFTSCCIGHFNHRYFVVFVFYMFLGTLYATIYNFCFIYDVLHFESLGSLWKIVFPLVALFVFFTYKEWFLAATLLTAIGSAFTGVLLVFHGKLILRNKTTHEKEPECFKYDRGAIANIKDVFGDKWYLVWLSPLIKSELPQDGINWIVGSSQKAK